MDMHWRIARCRIGGARGEKAAKPRVGDNHTGQEDEQHNQCHPDGHADQQLPVFPPSLGSDFLAQLDWDSAEGLFKAVHAFVHIRSCRGRLVETGVSQADAVGIAARAGAVVRRQWAVARMDILQGGVAFSGIVTQRAKLADGEWADGISEAERLHGRFSGWDMARSYRRSARAAAMISRSRRGPVRRMGAKTPGNADGAPGGDAGVAGASPDYMLHLIPRAVPWAAAPPHAASLFIFLQKIQTTPAPPHPRNIRYLALLPQLIHHRATAGTKKAGAMAGPRLQHCCASAVRTRCLP